MGYSPELRKIMSDSPAGELNRQVQEKLNGVSKSEEEKLRLRERFNGATLRVNALDQDIALLQTTQELMSDEEFGRLYRNVLDTTRTLEKEITGVRESRYLSRN